MAGIEYWTNNPDFRLFKDEDPNNPEWCAVSKPFVEWGDNLVARLVQDPLPGKVGFAKWKLLDRYARLYHKTSTEHRAETNLDNHPCLHQALLLIWQKLEDVEIQAAIPELEPPSPPRLQILPSPAHPVVEVEPEPDPPLQEVSGIILGIEEEDEEADESDVR